MSHYLPPGVTPPLPPAPTANTYRQPTVAAGNAPDDPHHDTLISEWRAHHAGEWVRADALHPAVRRMIDERQRLPAIRQKLRQLVATHRELEAKLVGNRARPVVLYRVTKIDPVGLEG